LTNSASEDYLGHALQICASSSSSKAVIAIIGTSIGSFGYMGYGKAQLVTKDPRYQIMDTLVKILACEQEPAGSG